MEPALEQPTASFTADSTYARRVVRAALRRSLTRGPIPFALPVVWVVLFALLQPRSADDLVGFVLAIAFSGVVMVVALRRLLARRSAPFTQPGTVMSMRIEDDGLWIANPLSTGTVSYSALRDAQVLGDVVVIRIRHNHNVVVLPCELFAGGDLEKLQARIAAAAPAGRG